MAGNMTISNVNVEETIERVQSQLSKEKDLSPALRSSLEVLLLLVSLLIDRLGINSKNSSKPPSSDPNREKTPKSKGSRKPGGQVGHNGAMLRPVAEPDQVKVIPVDRRSLPPGDYHDDGFESRQVFDLDISTVVTEFRAQVLLDQDGNRYVASFPEGVTRPAQYGNGVKVHSVYMSQFQLIPYKRIENHFLDQMQLPISAGSIFNFNQEAYGLLEGFDKWVKSQLVASDLIHADETGINIGGKRVWLHNASNKEFTYFSPHAKRGGEALDEIGILSEFMGTLCHDHWKPYFKYGARHALCNAHLLRELERAWEQDKQEWARAMSDLLTEINKTVLDTGDQLGDIANKSYHQRYDDLLAEAEKECPPPDESQRQGRRGRLARSKARNLLERFRDFKSDILRFMEDPGVPFTNNLAENDLRMTKVQQKISGCFRSWGGAKIFCRVRSYLSTCRKQGVSASEALRLLFEGKLPEFMKTTELPAKLCKKD
jgi:transposase